MNPAQSAHAAAVPEWVAVVRDKVESLRFGVVQIVVHDGKITQIERTERTRLDTPTGGDAARRRERV